MLFVSLSILHFDMFDIVSCKIVKCSLQLAGLFALGNVKHLQVLNNQPFIAVSIDGVMNEQSRPYNRYIHRGNNDYCV